VDIYEGLPLCTRIGGSLVAVSVIARLVALFGSRYYSDRAMRLLRRQAARQPPGRHGQRQHGGMQPSVGRIVHYVSYGTPGGEYGQECRAAIVTEVPPRTAPSPCAC
jgi:hypothetical protein